MLLDAEPPGTRRPLPLLWYTTPFCFFAIVTLCGSATFSIELVLVAWNDTFLYSTMHTGSAIGHFYHFFSHV